MLTRLGLIYQLTKYRRPGSHFRRSLTCITLAMANRICQHREIHQKIVRLADSPVSMVRSKAFILIELVLQQQPDYLLQYCKLKFVAQVEREWKRLGITDINNPNRPGLRSE